MNGVAVLVSDDNWMANKKLFLKNKFETGWRSRTIISIIGEKV